MEWIENQMSEEVFEPHGRDDLDNFLGGLLPYRCASTTTSTVITNSSTFNTTTTTINTAMIAPMLLLSTLF